MTSTRRLITRYAERALVPEAIIDNTDSSSPNSGDAFRLQETSGRFGKIVLEF